MRPSARADERALPCMSTQTQFVPEHRLGLIDWEPACAGGPLLDLAQLGGFAFPRPDERANLLESYLARRPTAAGDAGAPLARVMAFAFHVAAFTLAQALSGGARFESAPVSLTEPLPPVGRSRGRAGARIQDWRHCR